MANPRFESSTNVDPGCLQSLHAEYRGLEPDETVTIDSPLIEERGVMHRDLDSAWFADQLRHNDTHLETAWSEGDVIGFCLYSIDTGASSLPQLQQLIKEHHGSKVGYVSMICVTKPWTRKRVGEKLLSRAMRSFESAGVELAAAENGLLGSRQGEGRERNLIQVVRKTERRMARRLFDF